MIFNTWWEILLVFTGIVLFIALGIMAIYKGDSDENKTNDGS
jgi:hypothetical protein